MRKPASVIIWLASGVGPSENQDKYVLRLVHEGGSLEIVILWPTSLQNISSRERTPAVVLFQYKHNNRGVVMEDAKIVGFTEGLSSARVSPSMVPR